MTAAQAAHDGATLRRIVQASRMRQASIQRVLLGKEVWPRTYDLVSAAAAQAGVTDVPPLAPRASRKGACSECARLRERVAELEAELEKRPPARAGVVKLLDVDEAPIPMSG